ncbi:hypothetical protein NDI37_16480 [Funiculus sociatus GB2-A5]|uniref:Uncharacterized protein n=1 Tax=Funiculus sociatus GB2-A5 TaxID=2933946 RepID=A0ABV0JSH0_9CYAN|nr:MULTISPECIES: hypothetical protein [unclassified Trichocoleus]MBD1906043.1 hypothetical protein [Trichocoleus sp. FACHB-832]MBD2061988.1 hypothetical protein [Trichocoleus sp. FACHB-6]
MLKPLMILTASSTVWAISLVSPTVATPGNSTSSTLLVTNSSSSLRIAQVSDKAPSTIPSTTSAVANVNGNNNPQSVPMWQLMLTVTVAGAIGGAFNALISDNGFILPGKKEVNGKHIFLPGAVGNILTGAIAGFISWGVYGPSATNIVLGRTSGNEVPAQVSYLRLSEVAGAVIIGLGGARWLTSEVGKRILTVAVSEAANAPSSPELSQQIVGASPLEVLEKTTCLNSPPDDTNLQPPPNPKPSDNPNPTSP